MDEAKVEEVKEAEVKKEEPKAEVKKYKTSDIAIAACLILNSFKLLGLEPVTAKGKKAPQNHFYFVFEDGENRSDVVMGYLDKRLQVTPSDFMDTVRKLKQATKEYSQDNGGD